MLGHGDRFTPRPCIWPSYPATRFYHCNPCFPPCPYQTRCDGLRMEPSGALVSRGVAESPSLGAFIAIYFGHKALAMAGFPRGIREKGRAPCRAAHAGKGPPDQAKPSHSGRATAVATLGHGRLASQLDNCPSMLNGWVHIRRRSRLALTTFLYFDEILPTFLKPSRAKPYRVPANMSAVSLMAHGITLPRSIYTARPHKDTPASGLPVSAPFGCGAPSATTPCRSSGHAATQRRRPNEESPQTRVWGLSGF